MESTKNTWLARLVLAATVVTAVHSALLAGGVIVISGLSGGIVVVGN